MNSDDSKNEGKVADIDHETRNSINGKNHNNDEKSRKYSKSDLPKRHVKVLTVIVVSLVVLLLILFRYVRLSFHPRRQKWWRMFNSEKKDNPDIQYYQFWELFLSLILVPLLALFSRHRLSRCLFWIEYHPRTFIGSSTFCFCLISIIIITILHRSPCHGWIQSDVGYVWVNQDRGSHNIHMICEGHVWEPHVAKVVNEYLYSQGRAIDVGAFVGYHTLRMAKAAAPHTVYAIEGRQKEIDLTRNLRRNNAKNVKVIGSVIKSGWTFNPDVTEDLLESESPLAFIKIDCEGCEMHFLKAARDIILKWKPVIVIEIQDDSTRQNSKIRGQRLVATPETTRNDVLMYLRKDLEYDTVIPLLDEDGKETWDYLAIEK